MFAKSLTARQTGSPCLQGGNNRRQAVVMNVANLERLVNSTKVILHAVASCIKFRLTSSLQIAGGTPTWHPSRGSSGKPNVVSANLPV